MVFDLPLLVFSAVKGILKHIRIYSAAIAYVDIFSAVYAADKVYAVAGNPRNRASRVILDCYTGTLCRIGRAAVTAVKAGTVGFGGVQCAGLITSPLLDAVVLYHFCTSDVTTKLSVE